jgi:uncharacterized protein YybS (DUF2232 family)
VIVTRKVIIGMIRAAALAGALFLAGGAIPIVGGVAMLFAPTPILIFAVGRPGPMVRAAVAVVLAALLVTAGAGAMAGGGYLVTFGLATLIITWMIQQRRPFELIVAAAAGSILVAAAAAALLATGSPDALAHAMETSLAAGLTHGEQLYRALGMPSVVPADTRSEILGLTIRLSPALATLLAALCVLLNLRVFWRWSGKQRLPYLLFGDLLRWSAPEWLIWGLIATGFGMLVPIAPVSDIALNAFLCVAAVYFCQGLAVMAFYFQMLAVPSIVRGVIYFVSVVQPVVAAIVCIAGVFDMWIDFRRLKPPSQEAGNFSDFL